ncbi:hypothetical protein [Comamonas sp. HJ-2]
MLKKLLDMNVRLEAILLLVILSLLVYIFVRIVVPNFGTKALPAAWAAMFGAFVIFSYSVFFELEEEVISSKFNTYVLSGEKISLPNFVVPPNSRKGENIERMSDAGNITFLQPQIGKREITDLIEVGKELLFINALVFIGADYKDWKIESISYPGGHTSRWRKIESAGDDALIFAKNALLLKDFEYFKYSPDQEISGSQVSIYPPGTKVHVDEKIFIRNNEFGLEIDFLSPDNVYRSDWGFVAPFEVRVRCVLPKNRAGSLERKNYKSFCNDFMSRFEARLKVGEADFPKRNWGAGTAS